MLGHRRLQISCRGMSPGERAGRAAGPRRLQLGLQSCRAAARAQASLAASCKRTTTDVAAGRLPSVLPPVWHTACRRSKRLTYPTLQHVPRTHVKSRPSPPDCGSPSCAADRRLAPAANTRSVNEDASMSDVYVILKCNRKSIRRSSNQLYGVPG